MTSLILYGTTGCHLCGEAQAMVYQALGIALEMIEITNDPELLARYSLRIPVLRHTASGTELDWPFDRGDVQQFYAGNSNSRVGTTHLP